MNSPLIIGMMGLCLSWMVCILEYQHYHRLTTLALIESTEVEYLLDGLQVYAEAYYQVHKDSLIQPTRLDVASFEGLDAQVAISYDEDNSIGCQF